MNLPEKEVAYYKKLAEFFLVPWMQNFLSYEELGKRMGIEKQSARDLVKCLKLWYSGKSERKFPTLWKLFKYARALNLKLEIELYSDED